MSKRLSVQLWLAVFLTVVGAVLLFSGFWVEPVGIIDNSVLVAYGEIMTFVSAVLGVEYGLELGFKRRLNEIEKLIKEQGIKLKENLKDE